MKKSPHPQYSEQQDLIEFEDEGRSFQLHPEAFTAWKKMKVAARTEGINLYIVSAFRLSGHCLQLQTLQDLDQDNRIRLLMGNRLPWKELQ